MIAFAQLLSEYNLSHCFSFQVGEGRAEATAGGAFH